MRLRPRLSHAATFVLLAGVALSGCGSTTSPTPTLSTETLTGTVKTGGSDSKSFTVNYASSASDASVAVTALKTAAAGTDLAVTIGVGFGSVAFDGSCTRSAAYSATAAQVNQELIASGAFSAGTYCVQVFDAGTLTEDATYTLTVKHY